MYFCAIASNGLTVIKSKRLDKAIANETMNQFVAVSIKANTIITENNNKIFLFFVHAINAMTLCV